MDTGAVDEKNDGDDDDDHDGGSDGDGGVDYDKTERPFIESKMPEVHSYQQYSVC